MQGGGVEVAVGGERERARDRRRGHVQDVRRHTFDALGVERLALLDPEAVLLVDHAEAEAGELHGRLDQRVGADDQAELAAGEALQCFAAPRRRRRPGQQRERGRLFGQQLAQGHGVLLGERLGRRHQHRLEAGFERAQHRVERDHGLARADLAHQQPLHRLAGVEVGVDLVEGAQLVVGRLEGQRLDPAPDALPWLAEPRRRSRGAVRALARRQDRLVEEELLEAQPLARGLDFLAGLREVHGADRVGGTGEPAAGAQLRRQRLEHVADPADRLLHPLPQALGFELLGAGMNRDQAFAGVAAELVFGDAEAAFVGGAGEQHLRALGQLRGQPGLVEPGRPRRAALVADLDAEDREAAAAEGAPGVAEHLDRDARLLFRLEARHRDDLAIAVAVREAGEQVADRRQPGIGGHLGELRPDPVQRLQGDVEGAYPRPVELGVAQLRLG